MWAVRRAETKPPRGLVGGPKVLRMRAGNIGELRKCRRMRRLGGLCAACPLACFPWWEAQEGRRMESEPQTTKKKTKNNIGRRAASARVGSRCWFVFRVFSFFPFNLPGFVPCLLACLLLIIPVPVRFPSRLLLALAFCCFVSFLVRPFFSRSSLVVEVVNACVSLCYSYSRGRPARERWGGPPFIH